MISRASSRAVALAAVLAALAALPAPALADPAVALRIAKGPYLQAIGPTGATLKLELDAPAKVQLEVTGPGGFRREVADDAPRAFHAVRVAGLAPATRYDYRLRLAGAGGAEAEASGAFTTAPVDDRPFRFVVYGDSRTDAEAHAAVVRRIREERVDFLVNTGDLVARGDDPGQWKTFFAIEGELLHDTCVYACVGNHELYGGKAGEVAFLRYFGDADGDGEHPDRLYTTVRWGNTRFFLLNAMDEWTGDERAWLASALAEARTEPGLVHRIAVLHHGPFSSGPHGGNPRLADGGVVAMMRDAKVDLVLAGHDHIYERGEGQGLKYVISGGAGAPLYPRGRQAAETLAFEPAHHFVSIAVDGPAVRMTATRASGSVIERCGFTASGPWACDGATTEPAKAPAGAPTPAKADAKADAKTDAPPPKTASCLCGLAGGRESGGAHAGAALAAGLAAAVLRRRRRV